VVIGVFTYRWNLAVGTLVRSKCLTGILVCFVKTRNSFEIVATFTSNIIFFMEPGGGVVVKALRY
jgi:hypothetical protein